MRLNKWATRLAVLLTTPIILFASFIEVAATLNGDHVAKIEAYEISDGLYLFFGYPLTQIINIFAKPSGPQDSDNWWAVPLLNCLFIAQWVIWAQLIALIGKAFQTSYSFLTTTPFVEPAWPDYVIRADGRRYRLRYAPAQRRAVRSRPLGDVEGGSAEP
jgi:hypothetical protein